MTFVQKSHLALRTNIIQLHSFSSVVTMENSSTLLWYTLKKQTVLPAYKSPPFPDSDSQ